MATRRNHNRIAVPQQEATVLVEHTTAKIIKCTARKAFTVGNSSVKVGETFFLVRSERRENRYYVVKFSDERTAWQCSCGAGCREHSHIKVARQYIMDNVVAKKVASPKVVEKAAQDVVSESEYHKVEVISTSQAEKAIQEAERRIEAGKDLSTTCSLNGAMPGWLAILPSRSQKIA